MAMTAMFFMDHNVRKINKTSYIAIASAGVQRQLRAFAVTEAASAFTDNF